MTNNQPLTDSEQIDKILNQIRINLSIVANLRETTNYVSEAKAQLTALLREARIDELKNWRARTLLEANGPLNLRVEMENRIKALQSGKEDKQ